MIPLDAPNAPIEMAAYRCPHCKRVYLSSRGAVAHIAVCFANPARRSCMTCKPTGTTADVMRYCGNGIDLTGPRCSDCGKKCDEYEGTCDRHPEAKPTNGLRVECPLWEAKP